MTPLNRIPTLFHNFQTRWADRDDRMALIDQVVDGSFQALDPEDEALENRSPNLIQVALEDTAESASMLPSLRVTPSGPDDRDKERAGEMERLGMSYLDRSKMELLAIKSNMDLLAFGFFAWVVNFDKETGSPYIEWRDPRHCYPEPGWRTHDSVRTCMFARELYVHQLPQLWQDKVAEEYKAVKPGERVSEFVDHKVTLVELYEEDYITITAMYQIGGRQIQGGITMHPVLLERTPTPAGICPVVIGQRVTLDGQPRGQFDQVVPVLKAHIRLMALVLDYADQAVYSDIWVKDLVGQMAVGGGTYIQLGPNGSIGRVPPAVSSLQVQNDLQDLVSNIHLGGRWPKSRPGEIDQSIASSKFLESSVGMMNTVIRTLHLLMGAALEQALRICFKVDHQMGKNRTVGGILRNQQFMTERKKNDIDLKAQVRIEYGIGLGRDPQTTMVLAVQGLQTGIFSLDFVQENFEGLTDVALERRRLDVQKLKDMAFAQLLQGLQGGSIPPTALIEIAKERANGQEIFELFDKYVVKPQEAAAAQAIPSGLGGPAQQPGAAPGAGGPMPPPPPGLAGLLAGLGGGGSQPPGQATEPIGRLSAPIPGGGFLGATAQ